jgi:hypothetical protein
MKAAPARSRVIAIKVAATSPGGSSASSAVVRMPATLASLTLTSPAVVSATPERIVSTCGG